MDRSAPRRDSTHLLAGFLIATILAAPFAFSSALNRMAWYDDEGTLMAWMRSFLDGHRMYDDVYAMYGPLYFDIYGLLYGALHLPLTHTSGRLVAATVWLAYAALYGALCFRVTRSYAATALAYVIALIWLEELMNSPGHPEELGLLLMAVCIWLASSVDRLRTLPVLAGIGAAVAALLMIKINFGAYVGGAVALVLLRLTAPAWWSTLALRAVAAMLIVLPLAVQGMLYQFDWVQLYAPFTVLTIAAPVLLLVTARPQPVLHLRDWWVIAGAGSLAIMVSVAGMAMSGSSLYAILNAVLLQNAHFVQNWYVPMKVESAGLANAAVAAALALAWRLGTRFGERREVAVIVVKAGFAVLGALLFPWSRAAFIALVPFCWLLLVMPANTGAKPAAARTVLAVVAAMMSLYPFPVAGSQVRIADLIPLLMVPILAHDVFTAIRARGVVPGFATSRVFATLMLAPALAFALTKTVQSTLDYARSEPLDLPGTRLIRLPPALNYQLRWVTAELARCGSSYSIPGQASFTFWAGQPLASPVNVNAMLNMLSAQQQDAVIATLARQPRLCLLYNPGLLRFLDRGQVATHPPLLRWMESDFTKIAEQDGLVILRHNEARAGTAEQ